MIGIRMARNGFSLIELMVVIVILALLISLFMVASGSITNSALSTEDISKLRSLTMANAGYAVDHKQRLLSPRTEPNGNESTEEQINRFWVKSFDDNVDQLGSGQIELSTALSEGAAWDYIGDEAAYKSPLDTTDRIRSYSLNAFIGVDRCADEYPDMAGVFLPAFNTRYRVPCRSLSDIPAPSGTICAIGEVDQGFAGFSETANANGWCVSANPNMPIWKDTPALWNRNRVNISMMDGSTETIVLQRDDRLREKINQSGSSHNITIGFSDQDKVDFQQFNKRLLPGVLEYRTASDQE